MTGGLGSGCRCSQRRAWRPPPAAASRPGDSSRRRPNRSSGHRRRSGGASDTSASCPPAPTSSPASQSPRALAKCSSARRRNIRCSPPYALCTDEADRLFVADSGEGGARIQPEVAALRALGAGQPGEAVLRSRWESHTTLPAGCSLPIRWLAAFTSSTDEDTRRASSGPASWCGRVGWPLMCGASSFSSPMPGRTGCLCSRNGATW